MSATEGAAIEGTATEGAAIEGTATEGAAIEGTAIVANKHWTLLVLTLAEGAAMTAAQIQKSLFLIQYEKPENAKDGPRYDFVPHQHGPYAPQVNIDAYDLAMEHYAITSHNQHGVTCYSVTAAGFARAAELRADADAITIKHAQNVVSWVRATSLDVIVREIGREFPQYRAPAPSFGISGARHQQRSHGS